MLTGMNTRHSARKLFGAGKSSSMASATSHVMLAIDPVSRHWLVITARYLSARVRPISWFDRQYALKNP